MHLPVLTYNIHSGVGIDDVLDLDRIAAVIAGSGAELVALQEVDRHRRARSAFADQPGQLADRLGMHLAYAACLDDEPAHPGAGRAQYGTALLSTRPLVDVSTTLLPRFPGSEQRGLLEASVELGGASLRVLGTHLQWDREDERLAQARAVTATLDDRPTLLLGDLNTTPGSATYEHLATRLDDSWARVGEGEGHTFDAELPPRRIDYVWVGGGVRPLGARVLPSPASDHAALLVQVEVPVPPS
ncbi:endonuclease/exonuclease/phosphatase family protein [Pedococcus sp. KACC 23699]|uniref:Endonuclease/exonuclease/phosphatase family protein n=1 Tax=Pedococcus sp. KACC 23699 TaxID=3149228 RepID=A0AAU7JYD8_9MICO